MLFLVGEPVCDEPWKTDVLDQAHHIEVKIPAVSCSGFRMKDQRASQLQLLLATAATPSAESWHPTLFQVLRQQMNGIFS